MVFLFWVIENRKSALSQKMDNIGLCVVIRYFSLKGLSFKEVYEDMVAKIREGAPSCSEEVGCVIQM